jgi:hypothetical protein
MLTGFQYYKPWELLPEHEDQIKRQLIEAQVIIDDELDEFERKAHGEETPSEVPLLDKKDDENMDDAPTTAPLQHQKEASEKKDDKPHVSTLTTEQPDQTIEEPEPQQDQAMEEEQATAGAEADTNVDEEANTRAEKEAAEEAELIDEHHGEMIVEAEEDTVIY